MTMTPKQHWDAAHRHNAGINATFMDMVTCKTNPMTREDLAACIERRPALWSRFVGFLDTLPTRAEVASRAQDPAPCST